MKNVLFICLYWIIAFAMPHLIHFLCEAFSISLWWYLTIIPIYIFVGWRIIVLVNRMFE